MSRRLTDIEKGYIAGFLDGEGCIGLGKRTKVTDRRTFQWVIFCGITNTNRASLEYIQKIVLRISKSQRCNICGSSHNRKHTLFRLALSSGTLMPLLRQIKDNLIVKKEQAELVLYAYPMLMRNRIYWHPENDIELERIYQSLRNLNKGAKLKTAIRD
jgi:hypothetical protein